MYYILKNLILFLRYYLLEKPSAGGKYDGREVISEKGIKNNI